MNKKKSRIFLMALSFVVGTSSFAPVVFAADDSNVSKTAAESNSVESKSKINKFLELKRTEKAKEIIESKPESSPLTLESKEEIVEYYADMYIPKEGCSLLELPADSDIDYVPPKPPKEEPKPKPQTKKANTSQPQVKKTSTKSQPTSKPQKASYNGKSISMSSEDRAWLEKLIEAEATGESYEGKLAVATVIANRVESSAFPNSVIGVIKATHKGRHQFSPWDDGRIYKMTPDSNTKKAVTQVFDNGVRTLPKETAYFAVKTIAFNGWMGQTRKHVTTIGNHAFFSQYAK